MARRSSRFSAARVVSAVWVWLCALLSANAALAQAASGVELSWQAPPACPQQSAVQERIQTLVGSPKPTDNHLSAEGAITQLDDARFRLKLVVHVGSLIGERTIESKSCKDLAGAAAVTLALLMRSPEPLSERELGELGAANAEADHAASANPAPPPQAAAEANAHAASPTAAERPPRRWHALLEAPLVALGIGPLPRPSFGVALGAGAAFERWRLSLELAEWLRQKLPAKQFLGADYAAEVERETAKLWACRAVRVPPFEVAPCLTLALQHISAHGTGAHLEPHERTATWLAPGVGVQARLPVTRWFSLAAAANAELETARPVISVDGINGVSGADGSDELGRIAPGAVTITVGSEWIL